MYKCSTFWQESWCTTCTTVDSTVYVGSSWEVAITSISREPDLLFCLFSPPSPPPMWLMICQPTLPVLTSGCAKKSPLKGHSSPKVSIGDIFVPRLFGTMDVYLDLFGPKLFGALWDLMTLLDRFWSRNIHLLHQGLVSQNNQIWIIWQGFCLKQNVILRLMQCFSGNL